MAQTIKQTRVLKVEFLNADSDTALSWSLNNPRLDVTRQDVVAATNWFMATGNGSGVQILYNSNYIAAVQLGKVQSVETNIITTDL